MEIKNETLRNRGDREVPNDAELRSNNVFFTPGTRNCYGGDGHASLTSGELFPFIQLVWSGR